MTHKRYTYLAFTLHSMNHIVNKPMLFYGSSQSQFSEMSFLVKFWGLVIELFFIPISTMYNSRLQSVFLARSMYSDSKHFCRGDTVSRHLSVINLYLKLDFGIIVRDLNNDELDVTTGGLARHSATTSSKMNGDFIKSALTTKSI